MAFKNNSGSLDMKDVVAHLLDGNIRVLSMLRDGFLMSSPDPHRRKPGAISQL